jgi:hypothetical protein
MNNYHKPLGLTADGVAFSVTVEYKLHDCVVSQEALSDLCQSDDKELDMMATYGAYEARINGVARRLVMAGITGFPILLRSQNFR